MSQLYRPPWAKLYYCEVVVDVAGMFSFLLPIKSQTHDRQISCWSFSEFCKMENICVFYQYNGYLSNFQNLEKLGFVDLFSEFCNMKNICFLSIQRISVAFKILKNQDFTFYLFNHKRDKQAKTQTWTLTWT